MDIKINYKDKAFKCDATMKYSDCRIIDKIFHDKFTRELNRFAESFGEITSIEIIY